MSPREILDYRDLESEIHDAVNMSEVACLLIEQAGNRKNEGWVVTENEMNMLLFSVYHANSLVNDLKAKWEAVHESNAARRVKSNGGAQ